MTETKSIFVYEDTGVSAPPPEPGSEYLVQVEQFINDRPFRWYRIMWWDHKQQWNSEDGGKIIFLSSEQRAVRWIRVDEITLRGWTTTKVQWNEMKGEYSLDDIKALQKAWGVRK